MNSNFESGGLALESMNDVAVMCVVYFFSSNSNDLEADSLLTGMGMSILSAELSRLCL